MNLKDKLLNTKLKRYMCFWLGEIIIIGGLLFIGFTIEHMIT